ncbi:methyltransferase domain-containing protein [Desertihabitans brevis]|uniref:Methyltransferase domain-containing protein n=1 Tax=Desertihabitans brevis TaxID=2268447 RepID=A0A367YWE2_9ACTN|nr:methyltransferase domain-containing protein [Desertihabitans brevis]
MDRGPDAPDTEVTDAFTRTAASYDRLVGLNPGYHDHLLASARALLEHVPADGPLRLLDLGCGSGASTRALVQAVEETGRSEQTELTGVDASSGMLASARIKRWPRWVRFRLGRAQDLGSDTTRYDGVLAAYLVRNVPERDQLVADLFEVLRPGGVLVLHEYAVRGHRRAAAVWTLVCWTIVIPLAALVARKVDLHHYLWRSVLDFDSVQQLQERLQRGGFTDIRHRTVGGWQRGIVHTVLARKPEQAEQTWPAEQAAPVEDEQPERAGDAA